MKVALYARVSTSDKEQNPETQLLVLRDFVEAQGWEVVKEYVDHSPANDFAHRTAWRALLDDGAKKRFAVVLVFKLDRAFRSVKHLHDTLATWEIQNIAFQSVREGFDTKTAIGRLMMNLLSSLAEFELELIRERVKAGMDRAKREGRRIGRPPAASKPGMTRRLEEIRRQLQTGTTTKKKAAQTLGIGRATLDRLLGGVQNGGGIKEAGNL